MAYDKMKSESYQLYGGINSKASPYMNAPTEFRDLTNLNFVTPGALTGRYGTSHYVNASVGGRITSGTEFERLSGASYLIATANTVAYLVTPTNFTSFRTGLLNGGLFSFKPFVDRLFAANGQNFFKFDGSNAYNYGLPFGASGFGVTQGFGGGLSGIYVASYGYLNERGYFGPSSQGLTITLNGVTFGSIFYNNLTVPSGYGITAIQLYRTAASSVTEIATTLIPVASTDFTENGALGSRLANDNLFFTLAPKYLEIYNNQLFMAGFSSQLSTFYWSQIGEPEGIDPTFNAEVRSNDSDRITGLRTYGGALVVTKERSAHKLIGDNPNNFSLQEISDQYGCLSHRTLVVWEDILWWLDSKGVAQYDGANIRIISTPVEPIFNQMNIAAARDNAVAIHFRKLNEIWFAIPVNSSVNNTIVVYDYISKAWTKYEGVTVSSLWLAKQGLEEISPFVGTYTGSISYFGESLLADAGGAAITYMMRTPYIAEMGQTTEKQYRRFYLDLAAITTATLPITVNMRTNYSESVSLSRTMYMNPFQSRIDFGLPAKSIQAEVVFSSASYPIRINGYSFDSRYQRST